MHPWGFGTVSAAQLESGGGAGGSSAAFLPRPQAQQAIRNARMSARASVAALPVLPAREERANVVIRGLPPFEGRSGATRRRETQGRVSHGVSDSG